MILFFILFTRQNIYLKKKKSSSVSKFGYFNQTSEYQKHYKINICFATVLMHKITAIVDLNSHEIFLLFQMEQQSAKGWVQHIVTKTSVWEQFVNTNTNISNFEGTKFYAAVQLQFALKKKKKNPK